MSIKGNVGTWAMRDPRWMGQQNFLSDSLSAVPWKEAKVNRSTVHTFIH